MPHHPEDNWRKRLATISAALEHERSVALEWKQVAASRLSLIRGLDGALTKVLERASEVERVFNVDTPRLTVVTPPEGASAEEVVRFSRTKLRALVMFTQSLVTEALKAEATITDVLGIAQEAIKTPRPACDTVPSTLAEELLNEDWFGSEPDSEEEVSNVLYYDDVEAPTTQEGSVDGALVVASSALATDLGSFLRG